MNAPAPTELLPCPFCGSTNLESGGDDKFVGTRCVDCEASGPNHYGKTDWNTRQAASVGAEDDQSQVFEDICEELGCAYDNEAVLEAICNLKKSSVGAEVAGEAVAWAERFNGDIISVKATRSENCTEPLYASPPRSEGVSKGEVKPHAYLPDHAQMAGDCVVCGHGQNAAHHKFEVQIDDPNMCPACFGDGYFPTGDLTGDTQCEACKGTGSRIPAAAQAGLDPATIEACAKIAADAFADPSWHSYYGMAASRIAHKILALAKGPEIPSADCGGGK